MVSGPTFLSFENRGTLNAQLEFFDQALFKVSPPFHREGVSLC
jgi:hypothetical protein